LLNTILESAKEAIIAVDENGIITAFNKAAYKSLNIPQNRKIKGQPIKGMISESDLLEALEKGEEEIGAIKTMNGVMVVSDRVPIKVESKNLGFICTFQNINKIQEIESKIRKELNNKGLIAKYTFGNIVGNSNVLKKTIETAYKYSRVDSNILLIGETGTGKELFAQSIHNASNRSLQPFVAINCAAVPENLLESELFGYVEGAFSGATKGGKAGLFELAHRGTIFLDEISEIPVNLQAKLLRVLQEREIRRIGDDKVIPVDVRVFSASNLDLREKVKEGTFRQDLLYRLDVLNLRIPPLREREEDIKSIAQYYIEIHCKGLKKMVPDLMTGAVEALTAYEWPGNIRELRNICERLVVLTDGKYITKEEIIELLSLGDRRLSSEKDESDERIKQTEESSDIDMETMLKLMQLVKVNKEDMAKLLGISRTTLWRRLKDK
ncbi:MAG: sigma-54 interaction domain-containing protein, partial [Clostridia bacterium]